MATNLEIIAQLIKKHDDEDKEKLRKARPHPFTITDYVVPPFVIPNTRDKKQINEFTKIYGSEIFYIESCVYLGVLKDLLDGHENVWLLYDGLYSDGIMMSELYVAYVEGLIKIYFDQFYNLYMGNRIE